MNSFFIKLFKGNQMKMINVFTIRSTNKSIYNITYFIPITANSTKIIYTINTPIDYTLHLPYNIQLGLEYLNFKILMNLSLNCFIIPTFSMSHAPQPYTMIGEARPLNRTDI